MQKGASAGMNIKEVFYHKKREENQIGLAELYLGLVVQSATVDTPFKNQCNNKQGK